MSFTNMFASSNNATKVSDSESDEDDVYTELDELLEKTSSNMIPENSRRLYEGQYEKYQVWRSKMNSETNEKLLLKYFQKLSESFVATTLWATYSKLKSMIMLKENIDISKYMELQSFLKAQGKRHTSTERQARVFTNEEIYNFLNNAPDSLFLLHKVVLVVGLHGSLRIKELTNIKMNDIQQQGLLYYITIPGTKTCKSKSFVTSPEVHDLMEKYIQLRPESMERFFVQYRNQKCTKQVVGKGKMASIPQDVAKYLNLDEPEKYTGRAFRRTSATIFNIQGADPLSLKRHGGWKSSTVVKSYENESNLNEKNTSEIISTSMNLKKSKTVTSGALTNNRNQNIMAVPSNSKINITIFKQPRSPDNASSVDKEIHEVLQTFSQNEHLTQGEKEEFQDINQEEYEEGFLTNFSAPVRKFEKNYTNTEYVSQEEFEGVVSTQFHSPPMKKLKKNDTNGKKISTKESEQVISTQTFENTNDPEKPVLIFRNCSNVTINYK